MGFSNGIGLKPCTVFFVIVALLFTTHVFAGGTVYVEIYSCPSIVRADEAVDVTVNSDLGIELIYGTIHTHKILSQKKRMKTRNY